MPIVMSDRRPSLWTDCISAMFSMLHLAPLDRGLHASVGWPVINGLDITHGAAVNYLAEFVLSCQWEQIETENERCVGTGQLQRTNSQLNLELSCKYYWTLKLLSTTHYRRKFTGCQMMSSGWRLHWSSHRWHRCRCRRQRRCDQVDRRRRRGSSPCWLAARACAVYHGRIWLSFVLIFCCPFS